MSIQLPRGATCLLIGPNGAGKTTLLKVQPLATACSLLILNPSICSLLRFHVGSYTLKQDLPQHLRSVLH